MPVNKKSLTNSKSSTKPATTKSVKSTIAPSPATAATALRTAKTLNQTTAMHVLSTKAVTSL